MSLATITVTTKKPARTSNSAGGKVVTYTTVATGLKCTRNYYKADRVQRLEETRGNSGPGVATDEVVLYTFHAEDYPNGFPVVKREYQIVQADATIDKALFVKTYENTMQVRAERVT